LTCTARHHALPAAAAASGTVLHAAGRGNPILRCLAAAAYPDSASDHGPLVGPWSRRAFPAIRRMQRPAVAVRRRAAVLAACSA